MPVVIAGLILAFLVAMLFGGTEIDRGLLLLAQFDAPHIRSWIEWFNRLATPLPLMVTLGAGVGYLAYHRRWPRLLLLVAIVLVGNLLVHMLGLWTAPLRPDIDERLLATQVLTFPSAPAANATITYLALAYLLTARVPARPTALAIATSLALTIGFGRIMVGADWPSDVIGGWALGLAWTLFLLWLSGVPLGDGTARPLRHSSREGDGKMDSPRTQSARDNDDSALIEDMEEGPDFSLTSGGQLQRDIGSRAEMQHGEVGEEGVTRVRDQDKSEGEANLPRFNER